MPLADFQTLVDALVRDADRGDVLTPADRDDAIASAVAQYSHAQPRNVVVDLTSPGGARIDVPAGFTADSRLVSIEYPVGRLPASELPLSEVRFYAQPSGRQIELPVVLDAGELLRVTYTGAQLVDAVDDTVPRHHRQAVASLAASFLCLQLASYYATEGEPTIAADTVDYKTKSDRFRALAKDYAAAFTRVVGDTPSDRAQGASVTVQLERPDALGNGRMFHPTRNWPR